MAQDWLLKYPCSLCLVFRFSDDAVLACHFPRTVFCIFVRHDLLIMAHYEKSAACSSKEEVLQVTVRLPKPVHSSEDLMGLVNRHSRDIWELEAQLKDSAQPMKLTMRGDHAIEVNEHSVADVSNGVQLQFDANGWSLVSLYLNKMRALLPSNIANLITGKRVLEVLTSMTDEWETLFNLGGSSKLRLTDSSDLQFPSLLKHGRSYYERSGFRYIDAVDERIRNLGAAEVPTDSVREQVIKRQREIKLPLVNDPSEKDALKRFLDELESLVDKHDTVGNDQVGVRDIGCLDWPGGELNKPIFLRIISMLGLPAGDFGMMVMEYP